MRWIPELEFLPKGKVRQRARWRCMRETFRSSAYLAAILALFLPVATSWHSVRESLAWVWLPLHVLSYAPVVVAMLYVRQRQRRSVRCSLVEAQRCPYCGYDLRADASGRCPECGCATKSLVGKDGDAGP